MAIKIQLSRNSTSCTKKLLGGGGGGGGEGEVANVYISTSMLTYLYLKYNNHTGTTITSCIQLLAEVPTPCVELLLRSLMLDHFSRFDWYHEGELEGELVRTASVGGYNMQHPMYATWYSETFTQHLKYLAKVPGIDQLKKNKKQSYVKLRFDENVRKLLYF